MVSVTTDKFLLIEHRLGGDLTDQLHTWKAAGVSTPAMARLLTMQTGVHVASQTVRLWLIDLGLWGHNGVKRR